VRESEKETQRETDREINERTRENEREQKKENGKKEKLRRKRKNTRTTLRKHGLTFRQPSRSAASRIMFALAVCFEESTQTRAQHTTQEEKQTEN
jgi:hypothetical protein